MFAVLGRALPLPPPPLRPRNSARPARPRASGCLTRLAAVDPGRGRWRAAPPRGSSSYLPCFPCFPSRVKKLEKERLKGLEAEDGGKEEKEEKKDKKDKKEKKDKKDKKSK